MVAGVVSIIAEVGDETRLEDVAGGRGTGGTDPSIFLALNS